MRGSLWGHYERITMGGSLWEGHYWEGHYGRVTMGGSPIIILLRGECRRRRKVEREDVGSMWGPCGVHMGSIGAP